MRCFFSNMLPPPAARGAWEGAEPARAAAGFSAAAAFSNMLAAARTDVLGSAGSVWSAPPCVTFV